MILLLVFSSWNLVSTDTLQTAIVSPNLEHRAQVNYGDAMYQVSLESPGTSWTVKVPFTGPGTDFLLTDDGRLVAFRTGGFAVYSGGEVSWSLETSNYEIPFAVGDYIFVQSSDGVTMYHGGKKPLGFYQVLSPIGYGEKGLAGVWEGKLRIYGQTDQHEATLTHEYPRYIAVTNNGVAVAFPDRVVFYSLKAEDLWEKELPVSISALSWSGGELWVAGTEHGKKLAHLWALDEQGAELTELTYEMESEPPFVSAIHSDGHTLRVFVSRVLYTYELE